MTKLLRFGNGFLQLELLRAPEPGPLAPFAATGHHALRRAALGMQVALRGPVTHEMKETLKIWNAKLLESAPEWQPDPAAMLQEIEDALGPPPCFIAPGAESAALFAAQARWPSAQCIALLAEDEELPDLPRELSSPPRASASGGEPGTESSAVIGVVRVSRQAASEARARVAQSLGLLASHAGAAAAVQAFERGGVALIAAPGEREFSLDRRGVTA